MTSSPTLDARDAEAIVRDVLTRLPAYVPGLRPTEGGASWPVIMAFARYLRALGERLNQAPDKNQLAFLDMLGVGLIPAQAARAPVVFQLIPGASASRAAAGTRVGAEIPGRSEPLVFETEQAIALSGAKLVDVATVWPGRDRWAAHTPAFAASQPFSLFERGEPIAHEIYLAHDVHFALADRAIVELQLTLAECGEPALAVKWEYWDGKVWREFKDFTATDQQGESFDGTQGLTRSGVVRLVAECADSARTTVRGVEGRWLRGRVSTALAPDAARRLPAVDRVLVRSVIEHPKDGACTAGFAPDAAFADGTRLDLSKTFRPFGARPDVGSAFYLSSEEVFSKPGAEVHVCVAVVKTPEAEADDRGKRFETDFEQVRRQLFDFVRALGHAAGTGARFVLAVTLDTQGAGTLRDALNRLENTIGGAQDLADAADVMNAIRDVALGLAGSTLSVPSTLPGGNAWKKLRQTLDHLSSAASFAPGFTDPVGAIGSFVGAVQSVLDLDLRPSNLAHIGQALTNAKTKGNEVGDTLQKITRLHLDIQGAVDEVRGALGQMGVVATSVASDWMDWAKSLLDRAQDLQKAIQDAGASFQSLLQALFHIVLGDVATVTAAAPATLPPPRLVWEYWDGRRWNALTLTSAGDGGAADLVGSGEVSFTVPDDWMLSTVGDATARWLRVRLASGSFNHLRLVSWKDTQSDTVNFFPVIEPRPPALEMLLLGYVYHSPWSPADRCLTHNDFVWEDRTDAARWRGTLFTPFHPSTDPTRGVYLGFDGPLPTDRVSVWADIEEAGEDEPPAPLAWEAWDGNAWEPVAVEDETAHLSRRGMVALVPSATAPLARFGTERHWVRARRVEDGPGFSSRIRGLHLNAAWAVQVQTVREERLGGSTGLPRQVFFLRQRPVLPGEVIEVRELEGARAHVELAILEEALRRAGVGPDALNVVRDRQSGRVTEVWVRWQAQLHFFFSGPDDRHYVIERSRGRVLFGDGVHGRIPPPGADNVVARRYRSGGGLGGNVPAARSVRSSLPCLSRRASPAHAAPRAAPTASAPRRWRRVGRAPCITGDRRSVRLIGKRWRGKRHQPSQWHGHCRPRIRAAGPRPAG